MVWFHVFWAREGQQKIETKMGLVFRITFYQFINTTIYYIIFKPTLTQNVCLCSSLFPSIKNLY